MARRIRAGRGQGPLGALFSSVGEGFAPRLRAAALRPRPQNRASLGRLRELRLWDLVRLGPRGRRRLGRRRLGRRELGREVARGVGVGGVDAQVAVEEGDERLEVLGLRAQRVGLWGRREGGGGRRFESRRRAVG
jgi:hypothetical protein